MRSEREGWRRERDSSAFAKATAGSHPVCDAIAPKLALVIRRERRRMAEREGFEPSVEFPLHTLSKRAPSTTRTSLRLESTSCERSESRLSHAGSSSEHSCKSLRFKGLWAVNP